MQKKVPDEKTEADHSKEWMASGLLVLILLFLPNNLVREHRQKVESKKPTSLTETEAGTKSCQRAIVINTNQDGAVVDCINKDSRMQIQTTSRLQIGTTYVHVIISKHKMSVGYKIHGFNSGSATDLYQ